MEDIKLVCTDCRGKFIFTVKGQETYKENGWTTPKRCITCQVKHDKIKKRAPRDLEGLVTDSNYWKKRCVNNK